jgi:hypothetical protein
MKVTNFNRPTIYDVPTGLSHAEFKSRIPDVGRRRHLSWGFDFDSRATTLSMEINDDWEPDVKRMHEENRDKSIERLKTEFGPLGIDQKIENFIAIDTKPFSVLAYHNDYFEQVRRSFVIGSYYPALVGACALGERILNHLILDMRASFTHTPQFKKVYRKDSFDDWELPITTLEAWGILLSEAVIEFQNLKALRHRSIHFNASTYDTLRDDALAAVLHMRSIIELQFGSFALRPWFITGTLGHVFIKKEYEFHPYVEAYFIPRCPFVGPLFGMGMGNNGWEVYDVPDYGDGDLSDEEFAREYNGRDPSQVMTGPPQF